MQLPTIILNRLFNNDKLVLILCAWDYKCKDSFKVDTCELTVPTLSYHDSQRATNMSIWYSAEGAYRVEYQLYYEPYIIANKNIRN